MPERPEVPTEILQRLRARCLDLPEAYEEEAWTGTRWCIRASNFAHVVMLADGWPPAYAQAAAMEGPACLLTFRLPAPLLAAPRLDRPPFFRPAWFPDIVGLQIDARSDWEEIEALVRESYRLLAPKKLAALVESAG